MAFTAKNWQDLPSTATPLSAAALEDLETRVTAYADSVAGSSTDPNALQKTLIDQKGDLLVGTAADTAVRFPVPITAFGVDRDGSIPVSDSTTTTGLDWSVKAADYNILQAGATPSTNTPTVATANTDAINTASAKAAAAGRPCLIPPGNFYVDAGVLWNSNTHLRGFGAGRSVLTVHSSVPSAEVFHNSNMTAGNSNITLENFEIDGNGAARGSAPYGAGGHGMIATRGTSALCSNIRFLNMEIHHSFGIGMGFHSVDGLLIQGCRIHHTFRDGISIQNDTRNARIVGNHVYENGDDSIAVWGTDSDATHITRDIAVVGNVCGPHTTFPPGQTVRRGGHNIAVGGCRNVTIAGNSCRDSCTANIHVTNFGTVPTYGVTVVGNVCERAGTAFLADGVVHVPGLEIGTKSENGTAVVRDVTIVGNTVLEPMGSGVQLMAQSGTLTHCKIANNHFVGGIGANFVSAAHGIWASQAGVSFVQVHANSFRDFQGRGIYTGGLAVGQFDVTDNVFVSMCRSGAAIPIDLANSTSSRVRRNLVRDFNSNHTAVVNRAGAANMRVMDNDFYLGGTSNVSGTAGSGYLEHDNVNVAGALIEGTAATAGVLV